MGEIKKYKLDRIIAFIGDDDEMMHKMISIFLTNGPELLANLHENIAVKNYPKVEFYAHKLKSSIDHFSIESLSSEIRQMEKYAREKTRLEELPDLIQKLDIELLEVMNQLKTDFNIQ